MESLCGQHVTAPEQIDLRASNLNAPSSLEVRRLIAEFMWEGTLAHL